MNKNKIIPGGYLYRDQSVRVTIKVTNTSELRRPFERTIQAIRPSMVRAAQVLGHSRWRGHNRGRVVAADIVKPTQLVIRSANHDERFACQLEGKKLPRACDLIDSPNRDPVV